MSLDERLIQDTETIEFLNRHGAKIFKVWLEKLCKANGEYSGERIVELNNEREQGHDLLTRLAREGTEEGLGESVLNDLLRHIQTEHHSISDFVLELLCLQQAINQVAINVMAEKEEKPRQSLQTIENWLTMLAWKALRETADVYEYSIETGGRGFCQTDKEGRILYANSEMMNLCGCKDLQGLRLVDFFRGADAVFLEEELGPQLKPAAGMRRLRLIRLDGQETPVGAEVKAIYLSGHHQGGYAAFVDLSMIVQAQHRFYERSDTGIVSIVMTQGEVGEGLDWKMIYANSMAQTIMGLLEWRGQSVKSIFPDPDAWESVKKHLNVRFREGMAEEYEVEITRPKDQRKVPILISAIPEPDLRGKVVGSTAFIRNLEFERALLEEKCAEGLFDRVADIIYSLIEYNMLTLTFFDQDLKEARLVYFSEPKEDDKLQWKVRWWKMPPGMDEWLGQSETTRVPDLSEFLLEFDQSGGGDDRHVRLLVEKGYKAFLAFRLHAGGKVPACLSLLRKGDLEFSSAEERLLGALPIRHILIRLRELEREKLVSFRSRTIDEMVKRCDDMNSIADVITKNLVESFGWANVSIFGVSDKIRLLSQKACNDDPDFLLDPNYEQEKTEGILGMVQKNQKAINIGDLPVNPECQGIYRPGYRADIRSECCLPIRIDGRISWLLNIEHGQENALSAAEFEDLKKIIEEFRLIIDHASLQRFLEATLESASDAIIVTDHRGFIQKINPAAEELLGLDSAKLAERNMSSHFVDSDLFEKIRHGWAPPSKEEIELLSKDGKKVSVSLAVSSLGKQWTGLVFIARDLTYLKKVAELEYLGHMYHEIAIQTKTPLSLVFSWVNKLQKDADKKNSIRMKKILKQLHQLELTYDRLALFEQADKLEAQHILLDLDDLVEKVLHELPDFDREKVVKSSVDKNLLVRGDIWMLTFCLRTILAYLLRFASEESAGIGLSQFVSKEMAWVEITGPVPDLPESCIDKTEEGSLITKTLHEMALGENTLLQFIETGHGGVFKIMAPESGVKRFSIGLPFSAEEQ